MPTVIPLNICSLQSQWWCLPQAGAVVKRPSRNSLRFSWRCEANRLLPTCWWLRGSGNLRKADRLVRCTAGSPPWGGLKATMPHTAHYPALSLRNEDLTTLPPAFCFCVTASTQIQKTPSDIMLNKNNCRFGDSAPILSDVTNGHGNRRHLLASFFNVTLDGLTWPTCYFFF